MQEGLCPSPYNALSAVSLFTFNKGAINASKCPCLFVRHYCLHKNVKAFRIGKPRIYNTQPIKHFPIPQNIPTVELSQVRPHYPMPTNPTNPTYLCMHFMVLPLSPSLPALTLTDMSWLLSQAGITAACK